MSQRKTLSKLDEFLFHEGTNFNSYEFMGVHPYKTKSDSGFVFRVWAPNADNVFIAGDFNGWGKSNPMKKITDNGIWEGFVDTSLFGNGSKYKFIIERCGCDFYKADPYARYFEVPPQTASVYFDASGYKWGDKSYLSYRKKNVKEPEYSLPINIYELHALSWKKHDDGSLLNYRELAHELAPYVKQMGYTHIELLPITEHPFDGSWGYQVTGYYAPTSRLGTPEDFKYFIDYMHKSGVGVILDWVPAHFPKDAHGLFEFDGSPLYEYQGQDKMEIASWGTRKFDVGRNEVQSFLISNALFWLREFHIDGLRVDAVASMLYLDYDKENGGWNPNAFGGNECLEAVAFFKKLGDVIRAEFSDVLFIAEESTAWKNVSKSASENGLGFNYKWNMGWMNDVLKYIESDPVYRKYMQDKVTFSLMYAFSENYVLPISHDEVVHGKKSLLDKMPGDYDAKFASCRTFLTYMMTHPGKKLSFMGNEIGQFKEWDYKGSVEWFLLDYEKHAQFQNFAMHLNHLYLENSALWEIDYSWDGFAWIDADNVNESVLSYIRKNKDGEKIYVVVNFTPVERRNFTIGVEDEGEYIEILNSNDTSFGGYGTINKTPIKSQKGLWKHFENTLTFDIASNGSVIFKLKNK